MEEVVETDESLGIAPSEVLGGGYCQRVTARIAISARESQKGQSKSSDVLGLASFIANIVSVPDAGQCSAVILRMSPFHTGEPNALDAPLDHSREQKQQAFELNRAYSLQCLQLRVMITNKEFPVLSQ